MLALLSQATMNTMEFQLKSLQLLLPLLINYKLDGECVAKALLLCFRLQDSRHPVVSNTANATFGQMVVCIFENLLSTDASAENSDLGVAKNQELENALLLFKDITALAMGDRGTYLNIEQMDKKLALELLDSILNSAPKLFQTNQHFLAIVKLNVLPMVIKSFNENGEFSLIVRVFRLVKVIILEFVRLLPIECEILLSMLVKILELEVYPSWQRVLVLELYKIFLSNMSLQETIFKLFDLNPNSDNLYSEICKGTCGVIFACWELLLYQLPNDWALSDSIAIRIQCLDQLDKGEAPLLPDMYAPLLAFQSILKLVEFYHEKVKSAGTPLSSISNQDTSNDTAANMFGNVKQNLFFSITLLAVSAIFDGFFELILSAMNSYMTASQILGFQENFEAMYLSLCCMSVTSRLLVNPVDYGVIPDDMKAIGLDEWKPNGRPTSISDRNILLLNTLLRFCSTWPDSLNSRHWFLLFGTLHMTDSILNEKSASATNAHHTEAKPFFLELYSNRTKRKNLSESLLTTFTDLSSTLFEKTRMLNSRSFLDFIKALCRLSYECLTIDPKKDANLDDELLYPITKLRQVALLNIDRILSSDNFSELDLIAFQLTEIAHNPDCGSKIRSQVIHAFGDIIIKASESRLFKAEPAEFHVSLLLKNLMMLDDVRGSKVETEAPGLALFLPEVRLITINIINRLLNSSGQNMNSSWLPIITILQKTLAQIKKPPISKSIDDEIVKVKSAQIFKAIFPCVSIICTDFVASLKPLALARFIETLTTCASLSDDLNLSLIAIGNLWSVYDYIIILKQQQSINESPFEEADTTKFETIKLDLSVLEGKLNGVVVDTLWMHLLNNLSALCLDSRFEVRNSANQTLFRAVSMNGNRFSLLSWHICLGQVLYPLLDNVFRMSVNSEMSNAMWDKTLNTTIEGVTQALIDFFSLLRNLGPIYLKYWKQLLDHYHVAALGGSKEVVRGAVVKVKSLSQRLKVLSLENNDCQLFIQSMVNEVYIAWTEIGIAIKKNSDFSSYDNQKEIPIPFIRLSDKKLRYLLIGRCEQETIFSFTSTVMELLPLMRADFGLEKCRECFSLLTDMISYHTMELTEFSPTKAANPKNKDLDAMTKSQSIMIEFLTAISEQNVNGEFDVDLANFYSDLISFPFLPFYSPNSPENSPKTILPCFVKPGVRKQTYVEFAAVSFGALKLLLEDPKIRLKIYNSDYYSSILGAIEISMKYRYSCPEKGSSREEPLWKIAAAVSQSVITATINDFEISGNFDSVDTKSILNAIASCVHSLFFYDW